MLLRQFGVETVPIRSAPASRLTLRAKRFARQRLQDEGGGEIAGASLAYNGALGDVGGRFGFNGEARVSTKDATPLMQVLAVAWPDAQSAIPVEVSGRTCGDIAIPGSEEPERFYRRRAGWRRHTLRAGVRKRAPRSDRKSRCRQHLSRRADRARSWPARARHALRDALVGTRVCVRPR